MQIQIYLAQAKLETLGHFDFVLMGQRNPLFKQLYAQKPEGFKPQVSYGLLPHHWFLSEARQSNWARIAAVNIRIRQPSGEGPSSRLSDALAHGLRDLKARRVALLPFSWRKADQVAIHSLYALWLLGHAAALPYAEMLWGRPDKAEFWIVTADDISPFRTVLEHDLDEVWHLIQNIRQRSPWRELMPSNSELKRSPVRLHWQELCLQNGKLQALHPVKITALGQAHSSS